MNFKKEPECPEHAKVRAVKDKSQIVGDFLAWLEEHNMVICEWDDGLEKYVCWETSINAILADYFQIDTGKLDDEKRAVLDYLQSKKKL